MTQKDPRSIQPSGGFFREISIRVKLVLRLMGDRRVNFLLKLLPGFTILYLFIPDLVIGPLDDAAVVGLGFTLFVELCPPEVVQEHLNRLRGSDPWVEPPAPVKPSEPEDEVVDGEFHDIQEAPEPGNNGFKDEK